MTLSLLTNLSVIVVDSPAPCEIDKIVNTLGVIICEDSHESLRTLEKQLGMSMFLNLNKEFRDQKFDTDAGVKSAVSNFSKPFPKKNSRKQST